MQERNKDEQRPNSLDNPGHGPQGIDKAPGEEPSQDNVQFVQESQKGKKVDADLAQETDRPLDNQDL
jgi:hypothetical protein